MRNMFEVAAVQSAQRISDVLSESGFTGFEDFQDELRFNEYKKYPVYYFRINPVNPLIPKILIQTIPHPVNPAPANPSHPVNLAQSCSLVVVFQRRVSQQPSPQSQLPNNTCFAINSIADEFIVGHLHSAHIHFTV